MVVNIILVLCTLRSRSGSEIQLSWERVFIMVLLQQKSSSGGFAGTSRPRNLATTIGCVHKSRGPSEYMVSVVWTLTTCWTWIGDGLVYVGPVRIEPLLLSASSSPMYRGRPPNWWRLYECPSKLPYISFNFMDPAYSFLCSVHIFEDLLYLL